MSEYLIQDTTLISIANKIRSISGTTESLFPDAMLTEMDTVSSSIYEQGTALDEIVQEITGKNPRETLVWDGDTTGRTILVSSSYTHVKLSEKTPTSEECATELTLRLSREMATEFGVGREMTVNGADAGIYESGEIELGGFVVIPEDNFTDHNNDVFPEKGTYTFGFNQMDGSVVWMCESLTIPGFDWEADDATQLEKNAHRIEQAHAAAVNAKPVYEENVSVTPTKEAQEIVPSSLMYDAMSKVTVAAIPEEYEDITTPLAELNTANGGTAATTMASAVDNTEGHASSQESLIAQIAQALEGKVGGGGSVETCTVTITESSGDWCQCFYSSYKDGTQNYNYEEFATGERTLTDVICGSLMTVIYDSIIPYIELSGGAEKVIDWQSMSGSARGCGLSAPKTAGATGTITLIDEE